VSHCIHPDRVEGTLVVTKGPGKDNRFELVAEHAVRNRRETTKTKPLDT
jgi:hypothetical protein